MSTDRIDERERRRVEAYQRGETVVPTEADEGGACWLLYGPSPHDWLMLSKSEAEKVAALLLASEGVGEREARTCRCGSVTFTPGIVEVGGIVANCCGTHLWGTPPSHPAPEPARSIHLRERCRHGLLLGRCHSPDCAGAYDEPASREAERDEGADMVSMQASRVDGDEGPLWECVEAGNRDGPSFEAEVTLRAETFPPGTRIEIHEPVLVRHPEASPTERYQQQIEVTNRLDALLQRALPHLPHGPLAAEIRDALALTAPSGEATLEAVVRAEIEYLRAHHIDSIRAVDVANRLESALTPPSASVNSDTETGGETP